MVKSKKPSMPPVTVWPEAAPSPKEDEILSISINGDTHFITWAIHGGVANNLVPTHFWRTPPIEIDDRGTNLQNLSTYISNRARQIIFGSASAEPTQQNAIRASTERRVSLLSVYIVSNNDDQLKTLYGLLSEMPCRIYVLKGDDFYTKEKGRYDGMETVCLASLKAAGEYEGYPALVFDGGTTAATYVAADENGNIMGDGFGPSLTDTIYGISQTRLASVMKELASLTDIDGKVLKTLPVFAKTLEEKIARWLCMDISRSGQFVIENFLNGAPSRTNDSMIKSNTDRVIHVTGEEAPLIARLLEPNCPVIRSPPSATTSPLPKHSVKMMKQMVHYGIAIVLKGSVEEFEKSTTAELDVVLIGQRIAKKVSTGDQDGDHVYRGCVACVHGSGSEFPYGIRYDDGDTEDMNAIQLYEAMLRYINVGEKKESVGDESSQESQPRQPPVFTKTVDATIAASQLLTKDKAVERFVQEKIQAQSKAAASATEAISEAASITEAANDGIVENPSVQGKMRPPKKKTPTSGAKPSKRLAKKTKKTQKHPPKNKLSSTGAKRSKRLAKKPKKTPPFLNKADKDYVGDRVAKDFNGEVYFGTVREIWYDEEDEEKLWQIKYDDSDEEDLEKDDLIKVLDCYEKEKHKDDKKKGSK